MFGLSSQQTPKFTGWALLICLEKTEDADYLSISHGYWVDGVLTVGQKIQRNYDENCSESSKNNQISITVK